MDTLKFLADVNVEKPIIDYLRKQGYDVKWIPDYNCEILYEDLLEIANIEKRILITNDKDFGELIFLQKRLSNGIILIRVKGQGRDIKLKRERHKTKIGKKTITEL
ncbi:MAG: DUF5615 family PIN-like protein [Nitrospinae bacterium]|nr:DUF5615 family PIN-like protein [Nitrospinota bacterium]